MILVLRLTKQDNRKIVLLPALIRKWMFRELIMDEERNPFSLPRVTFVGPGTAMKANSYQFMVLTS